MRIGMKGNNCLPGRRQIFAALCKLYGSKAEPFTFFNICLQIDNICLQTLQCKLLNTESKLQGSKHPFFVRYEHRNIKRKVQKPGETFDQGQLPDGKQLMPPGTRLYKNPGHHLANPLCTASPCSPGPHCTPAKEKHHRASSPSWKHLREMTILVLSLLPSLNLPHSFLQPQQHGEKKKQQLSTFASRWNFRIEHSLQF